MEIQIAFKALAFFAAFMAGRSLTAYFKKVTAQRSAAECLPLTMRSASPGLHELKHPHREGWQMKTQAT